MHWIDQALEGAQNLLLEMCGKFQVLEKQNALLEAQKGKGRKGKVQNLSNKELLVALKEEGIRVYGRKYSAMHCLWIPTQIFPLCKNPEIDLYSAECWLSPLAIKDGVKTELFKFISKQDHALMAHKDVGDAVSPLKSCSCFIVEPEHLHNISSRMVFKAFARKWPLISKVWLALFLGFLQISSCVPAIALKNHAARIYCSALWESIPNLPLAFSRIQTTRTLQTS